MPQTEPPAAVPAVEDDALSEILNTIRLRGGEIFRTTASAGDLVVQSASPLLHIIEEGAGDLSGGLRVRAGDLVLVPRGTSHAVKPTTELSWVTGRIRYESSATSERLLTALPQTILLRFDDDDPREWMEVSKRLIIQEVLDPLPGGMVMVSRIIDLLFIQTIRTWVQEISQQSGWLNGTMDPFLGPVITAVHRDPARSWSVDSLAATAHLSRSTFAERFTQVVGEPPMQYVAGRRLDRAAELLHTTQLSVQAISAQSGYASIATFSRAFRARHGASPLLWRRQQSQALPETE